MLELYDLKGNLIHRLDAGVPHASAYELDTVQMIQREEQLLLWFGLSRRVQEDGMDEDSFHYEVDGTNYNTLDNFKMELFKIIRVRINETANENS